MALYRALWLSVTGVLVIAGLATALVSLPWQGLLGLGLLALFAGPPLGAAIDPRNDENIVPLMYFLRPATIAVVGTIAVAGLIALSVAVALLFIALLAACSPPVLRRLLARAPWSAKTRLDTVVAAADTVLPLAQRRRAVLAVAHQFHRSAAHSLARPTAVPGRVTVCVTHRAGPAEPNGIHPLAQQRGPRRERSGPLHCQRPFQPPLL